MVKLSGRSVLFTKASYTRLGLFSTRNGHSRSRRPPAGGNGWLQVLI